MRRLIFVLALCLVALPARAEFKVRYPLAVPGEIEFENNGSISIDRRGIGKNNAQSYTHELEYGISEWWKVGAEVSTAADPGGTLRYDATAIENYFVFTPQGKYPVDAALFVEVEHPRSGDEANSVTFGPLLLSEIGPTVNTVNLLFTKSFGHAATSTAPFRYAVQSRLPLHPLFQPGVEAYGDIDDIGHPGSAANQAHRAGPALFGVWLTPGYGKFVYEVGYLFGYTRAAEQGTVRFLLEYEIVF